MTDTPIEVSEPTDEPETEAPDPTETAPLPTSPDSVFPPLVTSPGTDPVSDVGGDTAPVDSETPALTNEVELSNPTTPPANPDVTPAASEAPSAPDVAPGDPSTTKFPTDGNWSPEQIALADTLGLDTPQGHALSPVAREVLRGFDDVVAGIESWAAHARRLLAKVPENKGS